MDTIVYDEGFNSLLLKYLDVEYSQMDEHDEHRFSQAFEKAKSHQNAAKGEKFTAEGPAEFEGDILENPDLVWCDDNTWTEERDQEAKIIISEKHKPTTDYWRNKYEKEAAKNWDLFYKAHRDCFYKDRHYLAVVFPELAPTGADLALGQGYLGAPAAAAAAAAAAGGKRSKRFPIAGGRSLLELGCGVGNSVFPLLADNPGLFVYAYDFSSVAIGILQNTKLYTDHYRERCLAGVCDATADQVPEEIIRHGRVDLCLLQFCLSAISPEKFKHVARFVRRALRPGGRVLLRDYGRHDAAQLRFGKDSMIDQHFYARGDGTRSFFFTLEDLREVFSTEEGFIEVEAKYIRRQYANRAQQKARYRVWVHAKFESRGSDNLDRKQTS